MKVASVICGKLKAGGGGGRGGEGGGEGRKLERKLRKIKVSRRLLRPG